MKHNSLLLGVLCVGVGMSIPLAGFGTASAQPIGEWAWVDNDAPVAAWLHAAAYDTDRHKMVVYHGRGSECETWEWDSATSTWELVSRGGPSPRANAAMVYDRVRKVTILTGGGGNDSRAAEVWEWNGVTQSWTQMPDLPHRRTQHAMAFDVAHGITILYGGRAAINGNFKNDTLMYDGSTWTSVTTAFPGVQDGHAMTYDIARDRVVLVESNAGGNMDTYEWDTGTLTWSPVGVLHQPGDRYNPALSYDEARQRVVLVGGDGNANTWEYDGTDWTSVNVGGAFSRDQHTLVYDTLAQRSLVFAGMGSNTDPRRDLRGWDGSAWTILSDTLSPSPRSMWRTLAFDSRRGVAVAYGGLGVQSDNQVRNMAKGGPWEWNGSAWSAPVVDPSPGVRWRNALAYDSVRGVTVTYGGRTATFQNNGILAEDTWEYDGAAWTQVAGAGPGPRQAHSLAFDPGRGKVVLFGGSVNLNNDSFSGETWEFDSVFGTWAKVADTGPTPRRDHGMAYDARRGVIVLFGGYDGATLADTWEWDGQAWTERVVAAPPARLAASMASDDRGRTVLFGGLAANGDALGDLWLYDGAAWSELTPADVPSARMLAGACFDSARDRFVFFGGRGVNDSAYSNAQTWELALWCPADFNRDGFVNGNDYDEFAELFDAADPGADFNGDGFVNGNDYDEFADHFDVGC